MKLAKVIGKVVATIKDPALEGKKLLLIQPIHRNGLPFGQPILALDSVGAGEGERVFFVRGKEGSFPWYPVDTPSDCTIVGILDEQNFQTGSPP